MHYDNLLHLHIGSIELDVEFCAKVGIDDDVLNQKCLVADMTEADFIRCGSKILDLIVAIRIGSGSLLCADNENGNTGEFLVRLFILDDAFEDAVGAGNDRRWDKRQP